MRGLVYLSSVYAFDLSRGVLSYFRAQRGGELYVESIWNGEGCFEEISDYLSRVIVFYSSSSIDDSIHASDIRASDKI